MKVLYALAAFLLAAVCLTSYTSSYATELRKPVAQDLIGMNASDLLRTLGPPVAIDGGRDLTFWVYPKPNGDKIEKAVWLVDDIVVRIDDLLPIPREDRGIPAEGPHLGQHVRETVTRLGPPEGEFSIGPLGTTLRFGRLELLVRDGRVIGMTAKE